MEPNNIYYFGRVNVSRYWTTLKIVTQYPQPIRISLLGENEEYIRDKSFLKKERGSVNSTLPSQP